ncbi:MAG: DUF4956 domain-containing protein [Woeseiaceae bacterium]|nr:DUF4956 domain-containing protein [Woeseiaceae bacterium]
MRRSGGLLIPMTLIVIYYAFWVGLVMFLVRRYPAVAQYIPVGGVDALAASNVTSFEPVYTSMERTLMSPIGPVKLLFASLGSAIMTVPVSWAYFITSRQRRIDQSFLQTIMILPIVVTGISMIVVNSLALAFSLAGVVAAVRFRFALKQPSDAMYIFVAIAVGLGSGIGALGITTVISFGFVVATLIIWRLEYGKTLSGPFLTMMTRRDAGEDDY